MMAKVSPGWTGFGVDDDTHVWIRSVNNGNHHDEMYLQSQLEWLQLQDDIDFRRVYVKTWTPYPSRLRRHDG